MSFYEELLTLGQHLHERERLALYNFHVKGKKEVYVANAFSLLKYKELRSEIANGEILYKLDGDVVSYSARKNGTYPFQEDIRKIQLRFNRSFRKRQLVKFFAQTEVEVIWNFPLQGQTIQAESSYCILLYPYFDLRYFSNGRGRFVGLINKIKTDDKELLTKLRTL
jgi:hypothetical protein